MGVFEQKSLRLKNVAGLCAACEHSREIISARGSAFLLCERSFSDPTFAKYPSLPVLSCRGFAAAEEEAGETGEV
jgi:hypothetical protein